MNASPPDCGPTTFMCEGVWVVTFSNTKNLELRVIWEILSPIFFFSVPIPYSLPFPLSPSFSLSFLNPLLFIKKIYFYLCVYACACTSVCVSCVCRCCGKVGFRSTGSGLQVVMSYLMSVLGTEPEFLARALSVLNWWAISPDPLFHSLICWVE